MNTKNAYGKNGRKRIGGSCTLCGYFRYFSKATTTAKELPIYGKCAKAYCPECKSHNFFDLRK